MNNEKNNSIENVECLEQQSVKIKNTIDSQKNEAIEFKKAIKFVQKVKHRFSSSNQSNPNSLHSYQRFLEILAMYKKKRNDIDTTLEKVLINFRGEVNL